MIEPMKPLPPNIRNSGGDAGHSVTNFELASFSDIMISSLLMGSEMLIDGSL